MRSLTTRTGNEGSAFVISILVLFVLFWRDGHWQVILDNGNNCLFVLRGTLLL